MMESIYLNVSKLNSITDVLLRLFFQGSYSQELSWKTVFANFSFQKKSMSNEKH